jgi:uncharacterized protein
MGQPVVIITGASSGIGKAAAELFAQEGYRVVVTARRVEKLSALVAEITARGQTALSIPTDVSKWDDIENMVAQVISEYGRIDILINNAGVGKFKWLEEMSAEKEIALQINVNVTGSIQTARSVLPHMLKQKSGHIINMASLAGFIATPTYSVYAACKFALRGFTDALRREVGIFGIKVSAIYPGGVATEFSSHTDTNRKTKIKTPDSMLLTSHQVAKAALSIAKKGKSKNVILPAISIVGVIFNSLFPKLNDWLIEKIFTIPERKD